MTEKFKVGDILIELTLKDIKHVHLSVHPPNGRVTLVAPKATRRDVARAYVVSKMAWIRNQQARFRLQQRESPRQYVSRESHFLWGRRYLLVVVECDAKPLVKIDHRRITLQVRPGSDRARREAVLNQWYRSLLHEAVSPLIAKWERKLGVIVAGYYLQRMKTKWGSCNHRTRKIRLNTELAKKPKDLLEYVIVHEMAHLLEPTHNVRFLEILNKHYPAWREARAELNELPLAAVDWKE